MGSIVCSSRQSEDFERATNLNTKANNLSFKKDKKFSVEDLAENENVLCLISAGHNISHLKSRETVVGFDDGCESNDTDRLKYNVVRSFQHLKSAINTEADHRGSSPVSRPVCIDDRVHMDRKLRIEELKPLPLPKSRTNIRIV